MNFKILVIFQNRNKKNSGRKDANNILKQFISTIENHPL